MKIKTSLKNLKRLNLNLKDINFAQVGYKARELVEDQLKKEIDANNKKFPQYSDRWKAWRSAHGMPPGTVDLTITGHMLRSVDNIKVTYYSVNVGFNNAEAKRAAVGVGRNKKRPIWFLGLTLRSKKKLLLWMQKIFMKGVQ